MTCVIVQKNKKHSTHRHGRERERMRKKFDARRAKERETVATEPNHEERGNEKTLHPSWLQIQLQDSEGEKVPVLLAAKHAMKWLISQNAIAKGKEMRFWMAEFFPFHDSANDRNRVSSLVPLLLLSPLVPVSELAGKSDFIHYESLIASSSGRLSARDTCVPYDTQRRMRRKGSRDFSHLVFQMLWRWWLWWCKRRHKIEMKNT